MVFVGTARIPSHSAASAAAHSSCMLSLTPLAVHEYEEWGDARQPAVAAGLRRACPYTQLLEAHTRQQQRPGSHHQQAQQQDGQSSRSSGSRSSRLLPPVLLSCSLGDTRVPYWGPAKWAARARRLQEEAADVKGCSASPVLLHVHGLGQGQQDGGAGGGHHLYGLEGQAESALEHAFLLAVLGGDDSSS